MEQKTDTITIRIDANLKKKLQDVSEQNKTNLNVVVNQIISRHFGWCVVAQDLGWLTISRRFFRHVVDSMDKDLLKKLGETIVKDDIRSGIQHFYGKLDIDSLKKFNDQWNKGANIKYRYIPNGGEKYILRHDLGTNFSIVYMAALDSIFQEIGYKLIDKEINENSISFKMVIVLER